MTDDSLPSLHFERPTKPVLAPDARKNLTEEYATFYKTLPIGSGEEFTKQLSVKLNRSIVEDFQNALGGFIQQEAHRLATTNTADALRVQEFLHDNPLPSGLADYLPAEYRIFSLLMNTAKQFLSREQAHTDSYVLGNGYKAWAKEAFGTCLVTQEPLENNIEWHHVLRDGRPPIPLTKEGHEKVDASARQQALSNDPVYQVLKTVKAKEAQQKRHYSWAQLRKACLKGSNIAWRRIVQEALQKADLPYQDDDILQWLDKNNLFLSSTH